LARRRLVDKNSLCRIKFRVQIPLTSRVEKKADVTEKRFVSKKEVVRRFVDNESIESESIHVNSTVRSWIVDTLPVDSVGGLLEAEKRMSKEREGTVRIAVESV
jgi:hypothetical protein